jgi:thioesterase domain-containing protein
VDVNAVERVLRAHRPQGLLHCYGPTEATTFTTTYGVVGLREGAVRLPIGRPIANTRVYVLDEQREPVPLGVMGELCVGGAGLASGYLSRPGLTAERFVADPHGAEPGARMYQTGDLARYSADGTLEFVGRRDGQVKVRGYRVELGEIESRLSSHGSVREAVVVAHEDGDGGKRLVAYVTTAGDEALADAELVSTLRAHLSSQLPEYMVPSAYVRLAALPLSPNGKLDRRALPAPGAAAVLARTYEAPRGAIEQMLATIWGELLGIERVGRHDHFFELGGHSLLAVKLLERLRTVGLHTPLRTLLSHPILEDLAHRILFQHGPAGTRAIPARRTGDREPIFFVPTGMGNYAYVFELAKELDPAVPVYALPWAWEATSDERPLGLEAMAARSVSFVRAIQPKGPYRLAGYSLGGVLAHAMARHLSDLDETVSFLGLIDTYLPPPDLGQLRSTKELLRDWTVGPLSTVSAAAKKRIDTLIAEASLLELVEECQRLGVLDGSMDAQGWAEAWEQVRSFEYAVGRYDPAPLASTVHLFRATEQPASSPELVSPMLGWERVSDGTSIHVVPVPGAHLTMMTDAENRRALGALLSEALRTAGST